MKKFEHNGEMIILPPFLASKTLFPLINQDLLALIKPIIYLDGESEKTGYKAEILPAMCSLYLEARRQNLLTTRQKGLTIFEKDLFGAKEIIIKKRKNQEQNNLKSDKFIQNIQKDNLEFKDNDFESEIEKIALSKKKD
jgi:hypothetical protein